MNSTLSDGEVLFIADTGNHRIRAISAVCSQICENGGLCVGSDTCQCATGWSGYDCTTPSCSGANGGLGCFEANTLCVGPDLCGCAPGFGGDMVSAGGSGVNGGNCMQPTCVQDCLHGGVCSAPDTCACAYGWWDANCSTPVCSQTCGNGGNCTGPDKCSCPSDWQGVDCRTPVCDENPCLNGGGCVAPGTCLCPPQWHGPDCSLPVCTQGSFLADPSPYLNSGSRSKPGFWRAYSPCAHFKWCNATNGFDCGQAGRSSYAVEPLWGEANRNATGRLTRPARCMRIEVGEDVITQFQYVNSSLDNFTGMYGFLGSNTHAGDSSSGDQAFDREYLEKVTLSAYARYTPKQPFKWVGPDIMAEGGDLHGGESYGGGSGGFMPFQKPDRKAYTRPWYFLVDRQVAAVELRNFTKVRLLHEFFFSPSS